jgi:hypothetical protein
MFDHSSYISKPHPGSISGTRYLLVEPSCRQNLDLTVLDSADKDATTAVQVQGLFNVSNT